MRALRIDDSALNPGLLWGFDDAVAAVNAFMLNGNYDNFLRKWGDPEYNSIRWESYKSQLGLKGPTVTFEEMKEIVSYHQNDQNYTYHQGTQYIVVFDSSNFGKGHRWLCI